MAVCDVELRPARQGRELARLGSAHVPQPEAHAIELGARGRHATRRLRERLRERAVGVGSEQKDGLETGARRP